MRYMSCPNSEGWGPWSEDRELDLTPCFERGVLVPLLNVLFLLFAVCRIRHLQTLYSFPAGYGKGAMCWIKLLFAGVIAATAGLELVTLVNKQGLLDSANIFTASQLLQLATLVVSVVLHYYEQTRSRRSSDILLMYWLTAWFVSLVVLRTDYLRSSDYGLDAWNVRYTSVTAMAALFFLELWPRKAFEYTLPEDSDSDSELNSDMARDSPEETANIFSRMAFSWISPLLVLGQHRLIDENDMWRLPAKRAPLDAVEQFDARWQSELSKGRALALLRALLKTHGALFALAGVFKLFQDLMQFAQPMLLARLIQFATTYATDNPQPVSHGVFYATVMFLCQVVLTVFLHQYNQLCMVTGMMAKSSLIAVIYKKALWLSNEARQENTTGNIITLFSVDVQNISGATNTAHMVWSSPFQIILAIYLLYNTLGWSVLAGVVVMATAIPINSWLSKRMKKLYVAQMNNKEKRISLTEEALSGAKIIKLYAWERPFLQRIQHVRESLELVMLRKFGTAYALGGVSVVVIPFLVSFMTFFVYATYDGVSHGPLTAQRIFVSLSLFNLLKGPLTLLPMQISTQIGAAVSLGRIHKLLISDELDSDCITRLASVRKVKPAPLSSPHDVSEEAAVAVHVKDGKFQWSNKGPAILDNINFCVRSNEHLAVVGRVGSGKSSLASALLGDMRREQGEITIHGQVAYAPQQPWIMNATLRDNILFGLKYDHEFYNRVVDACALRPDLAMHPAGDMIEIGEKGINLSGGQKARVSLARAVYSRADVYILDDPLSAVDAHVGKHLFEYVIGPSGLLRSRCRIHITNAIPYVKRCDTVMLLHDGVQQESGTIAELMECRGEVYKLVNEYGGGDTLSNTPEASSPVAPSISSASVEADRINSSDSLTQSRRPSLDSLPPASIAPIQRTGQLQATNDDDTPLGVLIAKEESAVGRVSMSSYISYLRECTWGGVVVYVVGIIFNQGMLVLSNVWLKMWSSANEAHERGDAQVRLHSPTFYMSVYAMLGLCAAVACFVRYNTLWEVCVANSARSTHNKMLRAVFRSPMSYFDTTPLGRILQRFSKDQDSVDQKIPLAVASWSLNLLNVTLSLTVISVSLPPFSVVIIPVIVLFSYYRNYYLETSRTLKRLDSTTRSPIYAGFQETLTGVSTIRAYGKPERFIAENLRRIDANQRCYYSLISLDRWLSIRLEWISAFVVFGAALLGVVSLVYGKADAGLVGLAVTYALQSTQQLSYMLRLGCDVENNMCDYVRIQEIEQLPSEAPEVIEDNRPEKAWPEQGMLEFKGYSTRYREGLDLVLKDLSFRVMPNQKVGIVGRTGAGKSSLTLALFRIVEAAGGKILLDGEDIAQYGLFDVRSKLSIIPQDPVLFAGTVRENLDPFSNYADQEIWDALQHVHLAEFIRSKEEGLDFAVSQGGDNFSVGQRQLICLARALLKRAKVLVLDEATAAIDNSTDAIIQESIRKEFKNCTVLTIAHRLNTVIDSNMVLVLDGGRVAEYDTPQNLLANENGLFKELWAASTEN